MVATAVVAAPRFLPSQSAKQKDFKKSINKRL
jgi:hypothetical protein